VFAILTVWPSQTSTVRFQSVRTIAYRNELGTSLVNSRVGGVAFDRSANCRAAFNLQRAHEAQPTVAEDGAFALRSPSRSEVALRNAHGREAALRPSVARFLNHARSVARIPFVMKCNFRDNGIPKCNFGTRQINAPPRQMSHRRTSCI